MIIKNAFDLKQNIINLDLEEITEVEMFDASGLTFAPGIFDFNHNLNTNFSEADKALFGGITDVLHFNHHKALNNVDDAFNLSTKAQTKQTNIFLQAALTENFLGEKLNNSFLLSKFCLSFSNSLKDITNSKIMLNAFEYAKTFDLQLVLFANEQFLTENTVANDCVITQKLGLNTNTYLSETLALYKILAMAEQTGVKVHISNITSAQSVNLIADFKQRNDNISCDVAINNLLLTDAVLENYASSYKTILPLRSLADKEALVEGVKNGTINAISSANENVSFGDKFHPFAVAKAGLQNSHLFLSLCLEFATSNNLDLNTLFERLSFGRKLFNLPENYILFDLNKKFIAKDIKYTQKHNCAFYEYNLQGLTQKAIINNKFIKV